MKLLDDCRVQCRVRITGSLDGIPFEYTDPEGEDGSQFIWPEDEEGNRDPSEFWWSEGNMACDCNRACFLPPELLERLTKRTGDDEYGVECGHRIRLDSITTLDRGPNGEELPALHLNESGAAR